MIFFRVGEYLDGGWEVRPVRVTYGNWGEGVLDLMAVVGDLGGSPDCGVRADPPLSSSVGWGDDRGSLGGLGESAEELSPLLGKGKATTPGRGFHFPFHSPPFPFWASRLLLLSSGEEGVAGVMETRMGCWVAGWVR